MTRGSYALRACDYCDILLPGNELTAVTDRVLSGTREGSRSYFSNRTVGGGSSRSTYYRIKHFKICQRCFAQRASELRHRRFKAAVRTAVSLAMIVGGGALVISFLRAGEATPSDLADIPSASTIAADGGSTSRDGPPTATVQPSDTISNPSDEAAADEPTQQAWPVDQAERSQERSAPIPRASAPRDAFARAIDDATPPALEAGKPERWEAGGSHGYVVPSEAQVYDDRTCRNVFSTIFYGDHQTQSQAVRWCRENGGAWHLSN